jgi:hypothetical protein
MNPRLLRSVCLLAFALGCSAAPALSAPDAGAVDAGGLTGAYPDGGRWFACTADAGGCACKTDADCVISHSLNDPQGESDCQCLTGCGGDFVNQAEEGRREADNSAYCRAWDMPDGFPDGGGCFFFDGICGRLTAACDEGRCVGRN